MFSQTLTAQVSDKDGFKQALDTWYEQLAPDGYLGGICGVSSDGVGVVISYYDTAASAHEQGEREQQKQWLADLNQYLSGDVTSRQADDVVDDSPGDISGAGFVQVIEGALKDPDRMRELATSNREAWAAFRPEILGSRLLLHNAGKYTMVIYFTDESAAREGEQKQEVPPELADEAKEMASMDTEQPTFLDIAEPWVYVAS